MLCWSSVLYVDLICLSIFIVGFCHVEATSKMTAHIVTVHCRLWMFQRSVSVIYICIAWFHHCFVMKNKNNFLAGAVRVEPNLPGTSAACPFFYSQCITRKCQTLKMKVKVVEYNISDGSILWQISTSIKKSRLSILRQFSSFSRNIHFKIVTVKMQVKVMTYNIRSDVMQWQISDFLSLRI